MAADVNGRAVSTAVLGGASVPAGPDQGGCVSEEVFIDVSRMNAHAIPMLCEEPQETALMSQQMIN